MGRLEGTGGRQAEQEAKSSQGGRVPVPDAGFTHR